MIHLIATLYMVYMSTFAAPDANQTVSQQVYTTDTAPSESTPIEIAPEDILPQPAEPPDPPVPAQEPETPLDYVKELKNLGFIQNEYDDEYLNIRNGVLRFQAAHNLSTDGDFGPQSTASLKKRLKDENFQYTDTVENSPTDGKWMVINKSKRILTLYEGKNVVRKYPIAVGNPPSLTPEGKYKIANRIVNPYWGGGGYAEPVKGGIPENPLGYRWMGLNIGNGGDYGIHGNNIPYSIGTDASHGCIRMINSDVESLFEIVSEGTPVWITSDEGLEGLGLSQKAYGIE